MAHEPHTEDGHFELPASNCDAESRRRLSAHGLRTYLALAAE